MPEMVSDVDLYRLAKALQARSFHEFLLKLVLHLLMLLDRFFNPKVIKTVEQTKS